MTATATKPKPARKPAAKAPKAKPKAKPARRDVASIIMGLLLRPEGATHEQLKAATGWKQCRAYPKQLAAKRGLTVVTERIEGGRSRYRAKQPISASASLIEVKSALGGRFSKPAEPRAA